MTASMDVAVARRLAFSLGGETSAERAPATLQVVPLTDEYWDRVVAHCLAEIRAGRTPNPDVLCNSRQARGRAAPRMCRHRGPPHGAASRRLLQSLLTHTLSIYLSRCEITGSSLARSMSIWSGNMAGGLIALPRGTMPASFGPKAAALAADISTAAAAAQASSSAEATTHPPCVWR